jgi:hypothetical protein
MLIRFGLALIAFSVVATLVSEAKLGGVVTTEAVYGVYVGAALIGIGILVRLLRGASRALGHPRCGRCGRVIEKGRIYCAEHSRIEAPRPGPVDKELTSRTIRPSF